MQDAKLTHLPHAPEIAQEMLRRQQATAIASARHQIVAGAVGMAEAALKGLPERKMASPGKKAFPLRIDPALWAEIRSGQRCWAFACCLPSMALGPNCGPRQQLNGRWTWRRSRTLAAQRIMRGRRLASDLD